MVNARAASSRYASRASVSCALRDELAKLLGVEAEPEDEKIKRAVREAAVGWLAMSAAIAVSGGGTSDFAANGGYPAGPEIRKRTADAEPALEALLNACADRAPALVAEPVNCLPLARLAVWVPIDEWLRPLDEWRSEADATTDDSAEACVASLRAHLLEKWETPSVLHPALALAGDTRSAAIPESAHRAAYVFSKTLVAAGSGSASVKAALEEALCGEPQEG